MLDIIIFDTDKKERERLHRMCLECMMREDRSGEIYEAEEQEKLLGQAEERELSGVFFLEIVKLKDKFMEEFRKKNSQGYVVLLVHALKELLEGINPLTRPSGCLVKPVEEKQVQDMLLQIWKDYEYGQGQEECCRFQIKAKYYQVPWKEILYFESDRRKLILRTARQEFEFYTAVKEMESVMPDYFVRVHKSFLVNLRKISSINYKDMLILMTDGSEIFLSRKGKKELADAMERMAEKG